MVRKLRVRRSVRVPEARAREELLKKIRPLLSELVKVSRTEKQRAIDAEIMSAAGDVIEEVRQAGIEISSDDLSIAPLWKDAALQTDRRCRFEVEYSELGSQEAEIVTTIRVDINCEGVALAGKISCGTPFEDFMNPDTKAILLHNDNMSNEHGVDIRVVASAKPTLTIAHLAGDEIEAEREGGFFEVSFKVECGDGSEGIGGAVQAIKEISAAYAGRSFFERGGAYIRQINELGEELEDSRQVSEREALSTASQHII
jgi:hypothetical protein